MSSAPVPLGLRLQAFWVRQITYLFYLLDHYFSSPRPPRPAFKVRIPSRSSNKRNVIELLFYYPDGSAPSGDRIGKPLPVVLNIHGGGWTFGTASMDARWAARVNKAGAVLISIDYRLGPVHSFPVPIEDCEDAARWLLEHASEYNLDTEHAVMSGFSAGGNMSFATAHRLGKSSIRGILAFYPLVDHARTTEEKTAQLDDPNMPIASTPKSWQKLFRTSYLPNRDAIDLKRPDLSPVYATDQWLQEELPDRVGLWTCEYDYLVKEGEEFRKRLADIGKITSGRMIEGVRHAWDRLPTFGKGNPKMDQMYSEAIDALSDMVDLSR